MRRTALFLVVFAFFLSLVAVACGGGELDHQPHDGGTDGATDAGPDLDGSDGGEGGANVVTCETLTAGADTCAVTSGGTSKILKGNVLTTDTVYVGGQVGIDDQGKITCVGCDCAKGGETVVTCADAVISPGLINTHDHIGYTHDPPYTDNGVRYEDRQQWRIGATNRPKIPAPSGASAAQISWGELRFLVGGATSLVGSGGQKGLVRNLDQAANEEGLSKTAVKFDTFPLDDTSGTKRTADCNYGGTAATAASISAFDAYEPHTSEGIDQTAHNEFLCESSTTYDTTTPGLSNNLVLSKTAMIHGIGLNPDDYAAMASAGTSLIWSPRSNITLYGDTAHVSEAATMGVNIALGTDWMPSGSSSLLRELACADSFNATYLDHYFSDQQLWQMVTINAASVTKMDDVIGSLATGKFADISIFASHGKAPFRSVIEAEPKDVALVMRAGTVLYGDDALVSAIGSSTCDAVPVCTVAKRICTMDEVGKSYGDLQSAAGSIYPAFQCGVPENEPKCSPMRPESVSSSTTYTGESTADDTDGDGIANESDNCPKIFNPIRPMDNGKQGDVDNDGVGDVCDPCPLDAKTTTCTTADPNDRDHDGIVNASDNCPDVANPDQADSDHDGKGDACDACPLVANPGAQGCPATIYDVKNGTVAVGSAVHISNALVTGKGTNGFFVQIKPGDTDPAFVSADYSGLFVFTGAAAPALTTAVIGQRVAIDASVALFSGEIELDTITSVVANGTVEAPPAPVVVSYSDVSTGGPRAAKLEGVLVQVGPSSVSAVDATSFTMTDPAAATDGGVTTLVGDSFLYLPTPALTVGQALTSVTGVLAFRQSASKLEPRGAADIVTGPPSIAAFSPALAYARVGVTNAAPTFAPSLTVNLSGPAQGATQVDLVSSDPTALTVPASVTVLDTTTSIVVPVTAVAQAADVTVTASLHTDSTKTVTGHVRVLGAAEGPTTVTLTPTTAAVAPNGTTSLSVTLDLPSPTDVSVSLALTPSANGTIPATVTVLANTLSATFTYTDLGVATTDSTVTATFLASTSTSTVKISTGVDHLVINEVDYAQTAKPDSMELVEIYNPSATTKSLVGVKLYLVNGAPTVLASYTTVDLSSYVSIPAQGYLVIGAAAVTLPTQATNAVKATPATSVWGATNAIQNGDPDGIALYDSTAGALIDALSYGGAMTSVALAGVSGKVSLTEGTATTFKDVGDGSLCRSPNGQDTDNASADWKLCATVTTGYANP